MIREGLIVFGFAIKGSPTNGSQINHSLTNGSPTKRFMTWFTENAEHFIKPYP
jgi:hypothetical protein